jgi:hypothetical protein
MRKHSDICVAIPTANRPELLALTLEKLSVALSKSGIDGSCVHIYADSVSEDRLREIEIVRDLYLPEAFLFHAKPHTPAPSGCWNILNAIKQAAQDAMDVYLVEEDVQVYPYFFEWHQSQTAPASCGRHHYDIRWKYLDLYTNPGSCLRRPLLDALIPHIDDDYFRDTDVYCRKHFPVWDVSTLDDWLIRRVMLEKGMRCVYPERGVCAHVGFRGYGQFDIYANNEKDIEKRIARAREILASTKPTDQYARDYEPFLPSSSPLL